jgi:hypothetical protein
MKTHIDWLQNAVLCPMVANLHSAAFLVPAADLSAEAHGATAEDAAATTARPAGTAPVKTFSDANWISMGGLVGANGPVYAAVVDDSGSLYIGGEFTIVGEVFANNLAKWNGSRWTSLGSGMDGIVVALAVLGNDLFAGGVFATAGGTTAYHIARWDGSSWTPLGAGMNSAVWALAVLGGDLYAGGDFITAGGTAANYIANWNGSSWSALGSGMGGGSVFGTTGFPRAHSSA